MLTKWALSWTMGMKAPFVGRDMACTVKCMVHVGWGIDTDTEDQYLQVIAGVGSSAVFMEIRIAIGSIYGDAQYIQLTPQIFSSDSIYERPDGSSMDRLFSSHT